MSKLSALQIFKQAGIEDYIKPGLLGAGIGGLGMGAASLMNHPEGESSKDRTKRVLMNSLTGAGLGGVAGVGAQALFGDALAKHYSQPEQDYLDKIGPDEAAKLNDASWGDRHRLLDATKSFTDTTNSPLGTAAAGVGGGGLGGWLHHRGINLQNVKDQEAYKTIPQNITREDALKGLVNSKARNSLWDAADTNGFGPVRAPSADRSLFSETDTGKFNKAGDPIFKNEVNPNVAKYLDANPELEQSMLKGQALAGSGLQGSARLKALQRLIPTLPPNIASNKGAIEHVLEAGGVSDLPNISKYINKIQNTGLADNAGGLRKFNPVGASTFAKGLRGYSGSIIGGALGMMGLNKGLELGADRMVNHSDTPSQLGWDAVRQQAAREANARLHQQ